MKNKLLTVVGFALLVLLASSCSTSRGYSTHKKGYGCPNSAGIKVEAKTQRLAA